MKTVRPKSPLALRIKELRDKKGITQEELAQKVWIPIVTLVKTEQGKIEKPAFQTIWKIAVALWCTLDEFVSWIPLDD
jgi:transcriptional regulator with XRE-family HTH domain